MGNLHGNPAGDATLNSVFNNVLPAALYHQKGFPGDAIEHKQYAWWCDYPDSDWDGYGDGDECQKHIYWNYNGGQYKNEIQNAKGADAFYAFNLQPQPFKATEEKQTRAKDLVQAASDKKHWQLCAEHGLMGKGGGGYWF